ncbi:MAG: YadA-like family protein, partial [Variovorax sp.]|nr:YadA-like family protein [Variovorax sp.]
VQQDASTRSITVAKSADGSSVDFTGTAGARTLTGVAAGAINAGSLDAVNGSQLYGVSNSVASALGGGSTVNPNGTVSAPTYTVGGTTVNNVGDAVTNLDTRTTANTADIQSLTSMVDNGSVGLVQQDASTRSITVAKSADGSSVDFTGTAGARTLTGVAAGAINAGSLDAVNGSQLYGVSQSVASALGGGSTVNPNGTVSASYKVNDNIYTNLNDALQGLAGDVQNAGSRLTVVESIVSTTQESSHLATSGDTGQAAVASGEHAVAIGSGASALANNSVALGAGSTTGDRENVVSVGSAGNERAIANVADGVTATDAVNKRQLDSVAESSKAYTDASVQQVQKDIARVRRDANAAAAAAMAVATLPQSILPGRGMVSASVSTIAGESAMAIGISKVSENSRWVTRVAGTANTRGDAGVSAGIGFHW